MNHVNKSRQRACPVLPTIFGFDDAYALATAYASGEADPVEVTEKCLEAAQKSCSVYISMTQKRAMVEAELSRVRYREKMPLSPLDGVPTGWKDLMDVAGTVTTAGAAIRRNNPPAEHDGPLPALSTRAGMVCIGKLNTTEFAYSSVGLNPHFGTPVNPHSSTDEPRIPGGSSSGAAVAVASGILPLAMGSDTGGSIRIPAAFNGIFGFKPTVGHYNRSAIVPLAKSLDTPGPLGRSVRDLILWDRILRGAPCQNRNVESLSLEGRRFVFARQLLNDEAIEPVVRSMFEAVGHRLKQSGALVDIRDVYAIRQAMRIIAQGWYSWAECYASFKPILDDPELANQIDQRSRKRLEGIRHLDPAIVVNSIAAGHALQDVLRKDLDGAMLVLPSVSYGAPPLNEILDNDDVFFKYTMSNIRLTTPCNMLDMPGVSLPAAVDENGMPVGVTIYGVSGQDEAVLEAALSAEEAVIYT